jgi:nucleotide-binding universal stress UspA family protein
MTNLVLAISHNMIINKILCALDHSPASIASLGFASKLAKHHNATIDVIHVFSSELKRKEPYKEKEKNALIGLLKKHGFNYDINFIDGDVVESIIAISPNYDLIVMGIRGSHHSSKFYGSTAAQITQTVDSPVFLIPERDIDIHFKKIVFASDFKDFKEDDKFEALRDLAHKDDAELHLLHISPMGKILDEEEGNEALELHEIFSDINHAFFSIENEDIVEGIKEHIKKYAPQLLAIMPRRVTRLASTISQAIINTEYDIPIFSFHA